MNVNKNKKAVRNIATLDPNYSLGKLACAVGGEPLQSIPPRRVARRRKRGRRRLKKTG